MGKTRRRGGAITDYIVGYSNPFNWGKSIATIKAEKCAKKREALDKECSPAEAAAVETPAAAQASAEMAGAPPAPPTAPPAAPVGGRRRRATRRKTYKGGKHRKGHRA